MGNLLGSVVDCCFGLARLRVFFSACLSASSLSKRHSKHPVSPCQKASPARAPRPQREAPVSREAPSSAPCTRSVTSSFLAASLSRKSGGTCFRLLIWTETLQAAIVVLRGVAAADVLRSLLDVPRRLDDGSEPVDLHSTCSTSYQL